MAEMDEPPVLQTLEEIDPEVLAELKECFSLFDQKNAGTMDIKHMGLALKSLGLSLTEEELQIAEQLNSPGSRNVEAKAFYLFAAQKLLETEELPALKAAFATFDPDREGQIPVDRFKRWMTNLGEPFTEQEVKECIKLGDPAGKGFINYSDLSAVLTSD